jgi:hypothetical protein
MLMERMIHHAVIDNFPYFIGVQTGMRGISIGRRKRYAVNVSFHAAHHTHTQGNLPRRCTGRRQLKLIDLPPGYLCFVL